MKIANVKGTVTKLMLAGLAAGAFVIASPTQAQAQQFAAGVQFGHPAYVVDRVDFRRREEFRGREQREQFARRQAFLRHQEWERSHRFERPYGYR
jgi:hypothetical protein